MVIKNFSQEEWGNIISEFKDLSLMQTWEYAQAKTSISSWKVERVIFQNGKNIIGAVQVFVRTIPVLGGGLVWINRGPLWRRSGQENFKLFKEILQKISHHWVTSQHYYVRIAPPIEQGEQKITYDLKDIGYDFIKQTSAWSSARIDLSKTKEELRKQFKQKWRTDLNGAERNGVECLIGTSNKLFEDFLSHYEPFLKEKKLSTPITSQFLCEFQSFLPHNQKTWIFEGRFNGELLGGLLMAVYGDTCIALAGSNPNKKGRQLRSGNLVWWQAILKMKDLGYHWFDVGGADPKLTPRGILHFKAGLRGIPFQLIGEFECSRNKLIDYALKWYIQLTHK